MTTNDENPKNDLDTATLGQLSDECFLAALKTLHAQFPNYCGILVMVLGTDGDSTNTAIISSSPDAIMTGRLLIEAGEKYPKGEITHHDHATH